jgi:probable phosphoglycerate mutase
MGLSPEGVAQAQRLRDRLATLRDFGADVLISSPIPRAQQTAEILAPALGVPILYDPDVQEWRNVEGHTLRLEGFVAAMQTLAPDQRAFYHPAQDGEYWARFMFRACVTLNRITQQYAGKRIMVICHGGIIEASFHLFLNLGFLQFPPIAFDPLYTSITHWQRVTLMDAERWQLERFNDVSHLLQPPAPNNK